MVGRGQRSEVRMVGRGTSSRRKNGGWLIKLLPAVQNVKICRNQSRGGTLCPPEGGRTTKLFPAIRILKKQNRRNVCPCRAVLRREQAPALPLYGFIFITAGTRVRVGLCSGGHGDPPLRLYGFIFITAGTCVRVGLCAGGRGSPPLRVLTSDFWTLNSDRACLSLRLCGEKFAANPPQALSRCPKFAGLERTANFDRFAYAPSLFPPPAALRRRRPSEGGTGTADFQLCSTSKICRNQSRGGTPCPPEGGWFTKLFSSIQILKNQDRRNVCPCRTGLRREQAPALPLYGFIFITAGTCVLAGLCSGGRGSSPLRGLTADLSLPPSLRRKIRRKSTSLVRGRKDYI